MKFLFIVQGEGRGHMTQAISLSEMLRNEGHEIVHVLIGKSEMRQIPSFFFEKINAQVSTFESPNFVIDANNKKINIPKTIWTNLLKANVFFRSMKFIDEKIKSAKPDVVINFYDLLGGLYAFLHKPKNYKYIVVGHQYLLNHPDFVFPKGFLIDKILISINSKIIASFAYKKLALSFRPMNNVVRKKLYVVPPLLRSEIKNLNVENKGYILGYILNAGYADEIQKWHTIHQQYELHFFWDKKDAPEDLQIDSNLWFHKINDTKFLDMMSKCGAYCSTAGFESICEAMYLGKPIMMVPSYGHFEQSCNALDATLAGAGIQNKVFNLDPFIEYIPRHKDISVQFRRWADSAHNLFLKLLTE